MRGPLSLKFANHFIIFQKRPLRRRFGTGRLHSELWDWGVNCGFGIQKFIWCRTEFPEIRPCIIKYIFWGNLPVNEITNIDFYSIADWLARSIDWYISYDWILWFISTSIWPSIYYGHGCWRHLTLVTNSRCCWPTYQIERSTAY